MGRALPSSTEATGLSGKLRAEDPSGRHAVKKRMSGTEGQKCHLTLGPWDVRPHLGRGNISEVGEGENVENTLP